MLSSLPNEIYEFHAESLGQFFDGIDADVGYGAILDLVDELPGKIGLLGKILRGPTPLLSLCPDVFPECHKYLNTVLHYNYQLNCVKYYCLRFKLSSEGVSYNTQGMRNLSELLKKIRISRGLDPRPLAKAAAVSPELIYKIENGEITNVGIEKLDQIARALDVPVTTLIGASEDRPKEAFDAPAYIPFDIPVVGLSKAGRGGFFDDQGYPVGEGFRKIHRPEWIKDPHAYAVLVDGDSMEPAIEAKSIALVDTSHEVRTGDKVVARLETGEVMLKRVRFQGDLIILESLNQKYQPLVLKKKELVWMHKVVAIKLP